MHKKNKNMRGQLIPEGDLDANEHKMTDEMLLQWVVEVFLNRHIKFYWSMWYDHNRWITEQYVIISTIGYH